MNERPRRYALGEAELDRRLEELVAEAQRTHGEFEHHDYVRQLCVTALRLIRDRTSRGDLKLLNSALKELRHAFRVFAPYKHVRKVAVFGSARTTAERPEWGQAFEFARRMAAEGWMIITGAGAGVMGAAQEGAGREASFGVNIRLPVEQHANQVIAGDPKLMHFRYFFSRKIMFVKEAHAFALFPGGFGTHDEAFEALTLIQTDKSEILPLVFVDPPGGSYWKDWAHYVRKHLWEAGRIGQTDLHLFKVTDRVDKAVAEIQNFYSNYHSSRYVGELLVLRVRKLPDAAELERLNTEFADVLAGGSIAAGAALPEERGEAAAYPRLMLRYNRRDAGRLRLLIDRLNALVPEGESTARDASPHRIVESRVPDEAERQLED